MKKRRWYVADFETTGVKFYEENGYTKVWLYAICDEESNIISWGDCIEKFIHDCATKLAGAIVYFHNLRFDGSFIIDYLLRNGWTYSDDLNNKNKTFNTLIGDMGQWYSLTLSFGGTKQVHFFDSLKLLPFSVDKIAIDFKLPILKEHIDYDDYTIDDTRLEYVFHDVRIVAMALKIIKAEGMEYMTTASCAYKSYAKMNGDDYMKYNFPILSKEFLTEWRKAYRGGRSQVNPYYQGKILHNIYRYDINSMYPWVMMTQELPFGDPIKCDEPGQYKFELYHLRITFELKPDNLPSLLKKGGLIEGFDSSYYIDSDDMEEIWISNIDYELLQRHYRILYVEFLDIYGFYTSDELFKSYVNLWYGRKQVDKGAQRIVDKLMLNSLYGKFGSNIEGYHKIPKLDEDDSLEFENSDIEDMKPYYLPIAIAVTSYAHKRLDDGIMDAGIENFIYCDTDSIHTLKPMADCFVDQKKLGYYKLEAIEDKGKYVRQKTYIYHTDEEGTKIVCAGLPEKLKDKLIEQEKENICNIFKEGLKVEGKLMPKRVKGGTILYETTFKIKARRNTLLSK